MICVFVCSDVRSGGPLPADAHHRPHAGHPRYVCVFVQFVLMSTLEEAAAGGALSITASFTPRDFSVRPHAHCCFLFRSTQQGLSYLTIEAIREKGLQMVFAHFHSLFFLVLVSLAAGALGRLPQSGFAGSCLLGSLPVHCSLTRTVRTSWYVQLYVLVLIEAHASQLLIPEGIHVLFGLTKGCTDGFGVESIFCARRELIAPGNTLKNDFKRY